MVWEKLEWDSPAKAETRGLDKATAEADNSDCLNNVDNTRIINGILDVDLVEWGTVMAEYYLWPVWRLQFSGDYIVGKEVKK